ncbi:hypothetical protein L9F63_023652, partial [Diploptera punctata]
CGMYYYINYFPLSPYTSTEKLTKFRILSVDGTKIRFSFLDLIVCENGDSADESASCFV